MSDKRELKVGDMIRDNDPRMKGRRHYQVAMIGVTHVYANLSALDEVRVKREKVYTDGKQRRSGWSLVP